MGRFAASMGPFPAGHPCPAGGIATAPPGADAGRNGPTDVERSETLTKRKAADRRS